MSFYFGPNPVVESVRSVQPNRLLEFPRIAVSFSFARSRTLRICPSLRRFAPGELSALGNANLFHW